MNKLFLYLLLVMVLSMGASAAIQNASVRVLSEEDYSDVYLGLSTGGYRLMVEDNSTYSFRVFIKNGMPERSIHNLRVFPDSMPFTVNSITPRSFGQIKPMEIVIANVEINVPENSIGRYPVSFDFASDEFPKGVFTLESEIKVVKKIREEMYLVYTGVILGLLGLLIFRKVKIDKLNQWFRSHKIFLLLLLVSIPVLLTSCNKSGEACMTREEVGEETERCLVIYNGGVYDMTGSEHWDLSGHEGHVCGQEYNKATIEMGGHADSSLAPYYFAGLC